MISVEEAVSIVMLETSRVGESVFPRSEDCKVSLSLKRILCEDFKAPWSVPRVRTSIKDGYAVRAAAVQNGTRRFRVEATIFAGDVPGDKIQSAESEIAVYVTTGSAIPQGFDAVVEVEKTIVDNSRSEIVLVESAEVGIRAGLDIREIGSDVEEGRLLIHKGEVIGPAEIGALSMFGIASVKVMKKPKIGVLSTGDELVEPGLELNSPAAIYDTNRLMLLAALSSEVCAVDVVDLEIIRDQKRHETDDSWLERILLQHFDILITSGGVSMGDKDFVRGSLRRLGKIHVGKLFMKPGKPTVFATLYCEKTNKETLCFSLPGNPVSSIVTYNLLVAPSLRNLSGMSQPANAALHCTLKEDICLDKIRPEFHRAEFQEESTFLLGKSTGFQRSSALPSLLNADALLMLPNEDQNDGPVIHKGTLVRSLIFRDLRCSRGLRQDERRSWHFEVVLIVESGQTISTTLTSEIATLTTNPIGRVVVARQEIASQIQDLSSPSFNIISARGRKDTIETCPRLRRVPGMDEALRASKSNDLFSLSDGAEVYHDTFSGSLIVFVDETVKSLLPIHRAVQVHFNSFDL